MIKTISVFTYAIERTCMFIGYGGISTLDRHPAMQEKALREAGCKRIYTDTADGPAFFRLIEALARMEHNLISERIQVGILWTKSLGMLNGRPRKLAGAKLEAAETMLREGKTYRRVAEALGVTKTTVYRRCPWSQYRKYAAESMKTRLPGEESHVRE